MPRNSIGFLAIVWLCASVPVCAAERLSLEELNPEALRREEKTVLRTELALNLARKDYHPDHTLSAGYYHMGAMPSYMARGDFKLPAWFSPKERAGVAEQARHLSQARHNLETAGQALAFRIKDDYLMAETPHRAAGRSRNAHSPNRLGLRMRFRDGSRYGRGR